MATTHRRSARRSTISGVSAFEADGMLYKRIGKSTASEIVS